MLSFRCNWFRINLKVISIEYSHISGTTLVKLHIPWFDVLNTAEGYSIFLQLNGFSTISESLRNCDFFTKLRLGSYFLPIEALPKRETPMWTEETFFSVYVCATWKVYVWLFQIVYRFLRYLFSVLPKQPSTLLPEVYHFVINILVRSKFYPTGDISPPISRLVATYSVTCLLLGCQLMYKFHDFKYQRFGIQTKSEDQIL